MKKILLILPLIILLTGCGSNDGRVLCTYSAENTKDEYKISSRYIIYYEEGMVTTIKSEEIVTSKNQAVIDKFESEYTKAYKKNEEKYDGYTYKVSNKKGKLIVEIAMDYEKIGTKDLVKSDSSLKEYVKDNKISKEGMKKYYEKNGAVCN